MEMERRGVPGSHEAEILVSHLAGIPRSRLFQDAGREAGDLEVGLRSLLRRRFSGEPLQYILGTWEFYGRDFLLTRDTLIPRPETEGLVGGIVAAWRKEGWEEGSMLDVGTGCGAIAVTLAAELPRVEVLAVDVSGGAVRVARKNAHALGVANRVRFLRADKYSALKRGGRFDVVVSNPPYVSEMEWESLPREIREFEPSEALVAGPDGMGVIRPLVADAWEYLKPGGRLWLEIGESQGDAVRGLPCGPLAFAGIGKDLAGRSRVACWILPAEEERRGRKGE